MVRLYKMHLVRPVAQRLKTLLLEREILGSIPRPVQLDSVANGSPTSRRFSVSEALCRGEELRHSSHDVISPIS